MRWCVDSFFWGGLINTILYSNHAGSHIFKYCWHLDKDLLNLDDINNVRNGLLMFKPIEFAFDDSRICFEFKEKDSAFHMILLDESLIEVTVSIELQIRWDSHYPNTNSSSH